MLIAGIITMCMVYSFCVHATDSTLQGIPVQVAEGIVEGGGDFSTLFGATIEDGFFSGVKWGIAAAFYHALYSIMGLTICAAPKIVSSLSRIYTQWRDVYLGRAPLLEIHELQVLVDLLREALKEYEEIDIELYSDHFCTLLPVNTLSTIMQHIHEYVLIRSQRYKYLLSDKEVLFFLQLIMHTIESTLHCIANVHYRTEIIATTKTTIVIISKLVLLLQGPTYEKELYDPAAAWFSGKGRLYVLHY